jgi:hypothetical protein
MAADWPAEILSQDEASEGLAPSSQASNLVSPSAKSVSVTPSPQTAKRQLVRQAS